ncbi:MAG: GntR family transcriptional regulator, N-acetylglucosamine utilization regulator [Clostridia bacterium]|nr:GntR family transcriptional regulator, N-acetylglucosamine utilization regulator [Clostridia bacterium]
MGLDKSSPIPLYYQLKEIIRQEIEGGLWGPGDCLPAEKEFCEKYGLSRATVRQALADLEQSGLVERRQGKGTFVRGPKVEEDLLGFYSFSREMRAKGLRPSSKMISIDRVPALGRLANLFQANAGEMLVRILRLRLLEDEPLFLEKTYLPSGCYGLLQPEELSATPVFF